MEGGEKGTSDRKKKGREKKRGKRRMEGRRGENRGKEKEGSGPPHLSECAMVAHLLLSHTCCLGCAVDERWISDRKVTGSTPGRGAIKSTRSTQPSILPQ